MVTIYDINKLRLGLKIMQDGEPCIIIASDFVKPGKGQVFNRIRFRKLVSGKVLERTFKSGDAVKLADIKELNLMYLYRDNNCWYFMDSVTFEQVFLDFKVIKDHVKWLVEQSYYKIVFWDGNPIFLIPPDFVELKVVDIQLVVKGDTISSLTKLVVLSTGAVIKVPLFIKKGEYIKVNTRSSEYVSRVR